MTDRIRTTISLSPEVHEIFKRMAEAGGISVSRCMGDWLADTAEGAQFVAHKMEEARKAPHLVMSELRAFANASVGEVDALMSEFRLGGRTDSAALPAAERGQRGPKRQTAGAPSSNTGLKSPKKGKGKG